MANAAIDLLATSASDLIAPDTGYGAVFLDTGLQLRVKDADGNLVPQGDGGGTPGQPGNVETYTASSSISSGRLVAWVGGALVYYDASNLAHSHTLLGVALNGATSGQTVQVQLNGEVEVAGWGLTAGTTYRAGTGGQLSASVPVGAAFAQVIGRAITTNKLILSPQAIIEQ